MSHPCRTVERLSERPAQKGETMHVNAVLEMDVVALEQDDSVTVMLDMTAPHLEGNNERPAQAVIVVLDRSGSMHGRRLEAGKRALIALLDRLDGRDWFGLVAFDHQAHVVIPAQRLGDIGRQSAKLAVTHLGSGGSTDLSSGYLRGLQEAGRAHADGGTTLLVLSDGHANAGIVDPVAFKQMAANAASKRISTSTIGIGDGYDELILAEMAIGGNGNHTFALEADQAAAAVAGEVDGLLTKSVQAGSVLIKPSTDVTTIQVVNDMPNQAVAEGILLELGDFYSGEERKLLVTFGVPAMAALGLAQIAELVLTYVSTPDLVTHTVTLPISVNVVPQDIAKGRVPNPEVVEERVLLETQVGKRHSEEAMRRGDEESARTHIAHSIAKLEAAPSPEIDKEIGFLRRSLEELEQRGMRYTSKRLRADGVKKSRGYKSREQGGQWDVDASGEEST